MGDRVERLLEVHKAHIEWLLVLACLVHQYSEIRDLIYCPPKSAILTRQFLTEQVYLSFPSYNHNDVTNLYRFTKNICHVLYSIEL